MEHEKFNTLYESWKKELFKLIKISLEERDKLLSVKYVNMTVTGYSQYKDTEKFYLKLMSLNKDEINFINELLYPKDINFVIETVKRKYNQQVRQGVPNKSRKWVTSSRKAGGVFTPSVVNRFILFILIKAGNVRSNKQLVYELFKDGGELDYWVDKHRSAFKFKHVDRKKRSDWFSRLKSAYILKCMSRAERGVTKNQLVGMIEAEKSFPKYKKQEIKNIVLKDIEAMGLSVKKM